MLDAHLTPGGAQVRTSGGEVARILASHGETRPFAREGGRTNRGLPQQIRQLLIALQNAGLTNIADEAARQDLLWKMQEVLVDAVRDYHNQQRLQFVFDPTKTTHHLIGEILEAAGPKRGAVAQHLIGAKLELRFPDKEIGNESYSTADVQTGRSGDFQVGDVVFHVTVNPALGLYAKCQTNLAQGLRPYLLVTDEVQAAARQQAKLTAPGKIAVETIETFVSQNLEELSGFAAADRARQIARLLTIYNRRVGEVEVDRSLLIDLPQNLSHYGA